MAKRKNCCNINSRICGEKVSGPSQGLVELLKKEYASKLPFKCGISVGCGSGQKELNLVRKGIVDKFILYELSEDRIRFGKELFKKANLERKVNFILGDAFTEVPREESYDFVHWNNALHHMLDVDFALSWSRDVLVNGGVFYMDDYVGASRFQWSDRQLDLASRTRSIFGSSKYLDNPRKEGTSLSIQIRRPNAERLIEDDPSEAADSERILDAVRKYFPGATIKKTGGVVYHLVLNDMLANFDESVEDRIMLDLLLLIDELCTDIGESQYAVALACKK